MPLPEPRKFAPAEPSVRGEEPLLIGFVGPPGGGKTVSALRLATGMQQVRPGPVVLIDTEGGRSKKYSPGQGAKAEPSRFVFDFLRVDMGPPFRSHDFLAAIKAQLPLNPAAIIVDSLSDEHEGEGGHLEWHDEILAIPKGKPGYIGSNEWAAWAMPKAARKRLISGLLQIKVPLLLTFRAREKTQQQRKDGKTEIVNIGWMPVAPLEIVHTLDLTCILPPKADGVPVWSSEKIGEDFIVKLPAFLAPLIQGGALSEATGAALARWARGEAASPAPSADRGSSGQPGAENAIDPLGRALFLLSERLPGERNRESREREFRLAFGTSSASAVRQLPADRQAAALDTLRRNLDTLAEAEAAFSGREPRED